MFGLRTFKFVRNRFYSWIVVMVRMFATGPGDRGSFAGRVIPYLPTSPLGQDMTQGQFLSGV